MTQAVPLPSRRELFWLTVPQLGLMLCHMGISLTDLWVVGRLESTALAALGMVSLVFSLLMLLTSVAGSGCMAVVSQSLGGGKKNRAKRYALVVLCVALAMGIVVAALTLACLPLGLDRLPTPALREPVRIFVLAYACHLPLFYLTILMNSLFRAHKLVWLPLLTLMLMALVNWFGSVGFGLGLWELPRYGYAGVAWSTFASGVVGLFCNTLLLHHKKIVGQRVPPWRWVRRALPRLWRIGVPAFVGNVAEQGGSMVVLGCLTALPHAVDAVAGMTLGMRILGLVLFPAAALGMSVTICSGHLLGARQGEACYALGARTALTAGAGMAVVALALYVAHASLARLFTIDASVVAEAGRFLACACAVLPLRVGGMLVQGVFAGAGATRISAVLSVAGMWLVAVPLALMAETAMTVYAGMAAGGLVTALLSFWVYQRRKWLVCFVRPC